MPLPSVASWFPKCLTHAVTAIAPGCIPLLVGATGTVAWPVAAGVACLGAVVWLSRWETHRQSDETDQKLNVALRDYFRYLLQAQHNSSEAVIHAIDGYAGTLPTELPLDAESKGRLVALTLAVQDLRENPELDGDGLDAALRPLVAGHDQTQALVADALLEARERFDGVDSALADISDDLAAAAQSIKTHTTAEHDKTRGTAECLAVAAHEDRAVMKAQIAKLADAQITHAQTIAKLGATNATLAQQLGSSRDESSNWQGKYEAAIARQVETERAKGIAWKDTIESIREQGPAAVLKFLQTQAPNADERAGQAELYAEMFAAAVAAIKFTVAEDAARLRTAFAPNDAAAWNQYGYILSTLGKFESALASYRTAESLGLEILGAGHPSMAVIASNIGLILKEQNDLSGALEKCRAAECIARSHYGDEHPEVALFVNNVGSVLFSLEDFDSALAAYREAKDIDLVIFGGTHPSVARDLNNIGTVLHKKGDLDGALAEYELAERITRKSFGDNHPNVATILNNIGFVLKDLGLFDRSLLSYIKAKAIEVSVYGANHPVLGVTQHNIGGVLQSKGEHAAALTAYRDAERIYRNFYGDQDPRVGTVVNNIGTVLKERGDTLGAIAMYRIAERIALVTFGEDHPNYAKVIYNLSTVYLTLGDIRQARDYCLRSFIVLIQHPDARGTVLIHIAKDLLRYDIDPVTEARRIAGDMVAEQLQAAMAEAG